jgi:Holliday junction resolvase RusA-like endonuclease
VSRPGSATTAHSPDCRLQLTVVPYHEGDTVQVDNDNPVKPIQDAVIGLMSIDDRQITGMAYPPSPKPQMIH